MSDLHTNCSTSEVSSIKNNRRLQKFYNATVGEPLRAHLKTKAIFISIVLPLLSTGSVLLTHYVIKKGDTRIDRTFILQVMPYCYIDTLTYMLGAYWYLACEVLSSTARELAEHFQKVFS